MKSQASEQVLLKVSPMKGIMRFNNKGKFIPCYIGLFEIPDRVELMAYKLTLSPSLYGVHPVPMLKQCYEDGDYIIK